MDAARMIKEHARVVLTAPVPKERLETGDVGTVVHIYDDSKAFEVEFMTLDGQTAAVATVEASAVRPVTGREIPHSREHAVALHLDGLRGRFPANDGRTRA